MSVVRTIPLAPAYLLLLSAAFILLFGSALELRRRHGLAVAVGVLALLGLFFAGSGSSSDAPLTRALVEWLDEPALVVRIPLFEPFLWVLMLSLLAISLAEWATVDPLPPLSQAMRLVLVAVACSVVLAGSYRTLAFALLIFDVTAAIFLLTHRQPGHATGRLLLGVLSSAALVAVTQGNDLVTGHQFELGGLFSLIIWLRLGLFPLAESDALGTSLPSVHLGWLVVNMAVGLFLISTGIAPWVAWLAGATAILHGALAWLEPGRERALAHAGHALAGGIMVMAGVVGDGLGIVSASITTLAALVALELTSSRLGRPDLSRPLWLWTYLSPLLATVALIGVPLTLGWEGRGTLYRMGWEAGAPGALAITVVAEGAALSVLYRYWRRLLRGAPAAEAGGYRQLGAVVASVPFLIPVVGPQLVQIVAPSTSSGNYSMGALLGLVAALMWALFLGYGRRRLLAVIPFPRGDMMDALRLGWLLRGLGKALDTMSLFLLRIRAVVEGEHYLAWAILLALGLGLLMVLR